MKEDLANHNFIQFIILLTQMILLTIARKPTIITSVKIK